MDKIAKDFLINDELARHMASMSEAIDTIDPREKNKVTYSGKLIMLVTLSGVFCDCQSWNDIADFARYKKDFLRRFIPDLETLSELSRLIIVPMPSTTGYMPSYVL